MVVEATLSRSEESLQLFLSGFAARDLAEPLASFDETTSSAAIRAAMESRQLGVAGVRCSGVVTGWIAPEDVTGGTEPPCGRSFDAAAVIADTTSLNQVIQCLDATPRLFVRCFGQISGLVDRSDLQKPAMRMWLFGLVTITELRVTKMIDEYCPADAWRQYLSEGRVEKAAELQLERRRRGQDPSLLDCLQFADKGQIVARDERLRARTRFSSNRAVESFVKSLQDLRNNLAHSQDLSGDWDVIRDLANNLHRIVLGPDSAVENAPATHAGDRPVSQIESSPQEQP